MSGATEPTSFKSSPAVVIDIYGGIAIVNPASVPIMSALSYVVVDYVAGGPLGYQRVDKPRSWFQLASDGRLRIPTGCVPRIRDLLVRLGATITVRDHRRFDGDGHRPRPTEPADLPVANARLLAAVAQNPLGQIGVRDMADVIHAIALIATTYERARIVIVAATGDQVHHLQYRLRRRMKQRIGMARAGKPMSGDRITVSTFMHAGAASLCLTDIVVVSDANELGGVKAMDAVGNLAMRPRRIYAIRWPGAKMSVQAAMAAEAFAGGEIYNFGPRRRDVKVIVCAGVSRPSNLPSGGLDRKRAIWHDQARNRLISLLAIAITAGDHESLRQLGIFVNWDVGCCLAGKIKDSVTLLVESSEHARVLAGYLPGWRVDCLSPAVEDARTIAEQGAARYRIVTWSFAGKHGIGRPDVIMRADGGASPPELPGFPPIHTESQAGEIRLVDFAGDMDAAGRRDLRTRLAEYRRRGWRVDDATRRHVSIRRGVDLALEGFRPEAVQYMMGPYYLSGQHGVLSDLMCDAQNGQPVTSIWSPPALASMTGVAGYRSVQTEPGPCSSADAVLTRAEETGAPVGEPRAGADQAAEPFLPGSNRGPERRTN